MTTPMLNALREESVDSLRQLAYFVATLPVARYTGSQGADARHSIGKHVRHILDHYEALLAWQEATTASAIDYEHRQRDPSLEQRPEIALERLHYLIERLARLGGRDTTTRLVHLAYQADGQTRPLTSSLERELAFLTSHTIHHMAIIALLANNQGIEIAKTFGVHPSTLRHWQRKPQPTREVQS